MFPNYFSANCNPRMAESCKQCCEDSLAMLYCLEECGANAHLCLYCPQRALLFSHLQNLCYVAGSLWDPLDSHHAEMVKQGAVS